MGSTIHLASIVLWFGIVCIAQQPCSRLSIFVGSEALKIADLAWKKTF
jgi:hypothetical protein